MACNLESLASRPLFRYFQTLGLIWDLHKPWATPLDGRLSRLSFSESIKPVDPDTDNLVRNAQAALGCIGRYERLLCRIQAS